MEDSPEDLPKPARSTAARPFLSPRSNSGEGVTGPLELSRRRAAQLFTPPGSAPATRIADKAPTVKTDSTREPPEIPSSSASDGSSDMAAADAPHVKEQPDVDFEGDWTPAPLIEPELDAESVRARGNDADDDRLVVEQFEPKEIELTVSTSSDPSEHAIEVIGYDDANSLLKAAANDGEDPEIDGMYLESTEFSFEHIAPRQRGTVDSFWATAPVKAAGASTPEAEAEPAADETEATIDEETAGEVEGEHELAMRMMASEPSIDEQPFEWTDDPSTTIAHAQSALEPEPEHDPAPVRATESRLPDIAPPWMSRLTPANTQALEELKETEPWDFTPPRGLEQIVDTTAASVATPAPAQEAAAPSGHDVADALERIAARVRDGAIDVPAGTAMSDETALSAVLTALLRLRR
ncbi:MAG TPA: hypothetical protein VIM15_05550 [Gemmatimonadaceae bacterium]